VIRICDTCKGVFDYFPPEGTTRLKIYCDACMQLRRAMYWKKVDTKPRYCKVCFKILHKAGSETCGSTCGVKLIARRQRGDWPIEKELYEELQKGFTYDAPSEYV
jgi:hypothetical protein